MRYNWHDHASNGVVSPTYKAWAGMVQRCTNPNEARYRDYGGRGIIFDPRWANFPIFLEDMGEKPRGKFYLDRMDNDKNYCKENCRWITPTESARNRRIFSSNTSGYKGITRVRGMWCARITVNRNRKHLGYFDSIEEAILARKKAEELYFGV